MKVYIFGLLISLISNNIFAKNSSWKLEYINYKSENIRIGIKKHTSKRYVDTIMYLQGLGDSMLNHEDLFNTLNANGYNVISFDYRGQGGSSGKMNSTRIHNINELSEVVWNKYESESKKKILIGWSTGGLAAYRYSYKYPQKTKAVILLAPGIAPKKIVGETNLLACLSGIGVITGACKLLEITERSLTQNKFEYRKNPHVEKIKPNSPLDVPAFAVNLLNTAKRSRGWKISKDVKGMVYLSSDEDTYVDAKKTIEVLERVDEHGKRLVNFDYHQFQNGALHELDNEIDEVSEYLRNDIIYFLRTL